MKKTIYSFVFVFVLTTLSYAQPEKQIPGKFVKKLQKELNLNSKTTAFLEEGFEDDVPPTGWILQSTNTSETWMQNYLFPYSGLYAMCASDPNSEQQDEWLITPAIDLSGAGNAFLNFYFRGSHYWSVSPYDNCDLNILISLDSGNTWEPGILWNEETDTNWTSWTWTNAEIDLSSYIGESNVEIAFQYYGLEGDLFSIDNVLVYEKDSYDAALTGFTEPDINNGCNINGSEDVSISVYNNGASDITSFNAGYSLDGIPVTPETINHTILQGDTYEYHFTAPADLSTGGPHKITAYVSLLGDADNTNDTTEINFTTGTKTIPYSMGFEQDEDINSWHISDANHDGVTWNWSTDGTEAYTDDGYMYYEYNQYSSANDWLFSTCIELESGTQYYVSFWYKIYDATYPEKLKLMIGDAQDTSSMTTEIVDLGTITDTVYQISSTNFYVPSTGVYYLGWKIYSDACMYNLYLDDVAIDLGTDVKESKNNIIDIYPNPASDLLTISSQKNIDRITIYNLIGQPVYDKIVKDNPVNINTANYKAGIYNVRIEAGNSISNQKIVVGH